MEFERRFNALESRRLFFNYKAYIWQVSAWLGNQFLNKKPPDKKHSSGKRLLNLGCGQNHLDGFVNADFYRIHNLFFNRAMLPDWMLDLTCPLNCNGNFWDGVLIEHTNEHLLFTQNLNLFKEVYRTLKPGGICRIVIPDLDQYLNWDELRSTEQKMARFSSLPEAISNLTQNHAHMSVWNYELLHEVLIDVGFKDVSRSNFGDSALNELKIDVESHRWESLYLEAIK